MDAPLKSLRAKAFEPALLPRFGDIGGVTQPSRPPQVFSGKILTAANS